MAGSISIHPSIHLAYASGKCRCRFGGLIYLTMNAGTERQKAWALLPAENPDEFENQHREDSSTGGKFRAFLVHFMHSSTQVSCTVRCVSLRWLPVIYLPTYLPTYLAIYIYTHTIYIYIAAGMCAPFPFPSLTTSLPLPLSLSSISRLFVYRSNTKGHRPSYRRWQ